MRALLFFCLLLLNLQADETLKEKIARMVVVGFDASVLDANSSIVHTLQKYPLGGVILFDKDYDDRTKTKNISSPAQLKTLTDALKAHAKAPLLIGVDQEGGKVARLKPAYGFTPIASADAIAKTSPAHAKEVYELQAAMLQDAGINLNFAPVVDLALEPNNKVIAKLERSFGADQKEVTRFAAILIDAQKKHAVLSVLKHFPGHGSSLEDSHEGFVDVSDTWQEAELEPYRALIQSGDADIIMTAHVFNRNLDTHHPATLSYNVNTELLRRKMGFGGVVISDDMQMGAIEQHYDLATRLTLAINGGVDMVLFGNQLSRHTPEEIIETVYAQVQAGAIPHAKIEEALKRIENLFTRLAIRQRPIKFSEKRVTLTKEYIKEHYGFEVQDITIVPKSIVLHWTAVSDFEDCFKRFDPEELLSDRKDIAKGGALNVSAHFLVARDGTITQLMRENIMARHTIGLNYSSLGIENVGGENNVKEDLTPAQVRANVALIRYLKAKYPTIEYLVGHHEYIAMEHTPLWLERDPKYRTKKADPGAKFMREVREEINDLNLTYPKEALWKN